MQTRSESRMAKIDGLLYKYPFFKLNLSSKENELRAYQHDSLKGIDFDRINTCKTNNICSEVEDTAILNVERITSIENTIKLLNIKINTIEQALSQLSNTERKVIELKYFKRVNGQELYNAMSLSKSQCGVHMNRALSSLRTAFADSKELLEICPILKYI